MNKNIREANINIHNKLSSCVLLTTLRSRREDSSQYVSIKFQSRNINIFQCFRNQSVISCPIPILILNAVLSLDIFCCCSSFMIPCNDVTVPWQHNSVLFLYLHHLVLLYTLLLYVLDLWLLVLEINLYLHLH